MTITFWLPEKGPRITGSTAWGACNKMACSVDITAPETTTESVKGVDVGASEAVLVFASGINPSAVL
ncbi:hypothetical protein B0H34DRAFT_715080 [Crassisporium funariophilum]|nr:hypothetical protein B0H34DRAFT_715080 [Crassisporium funariophilum]